MARAVIPPVVTGLTNSEAAVPAPVPNPVFVNFLGITDFDYTNLDLWAAKLTVGSPGTIITYKPGQFVLWKSKMYKCILQNSQIEPGVTSGWATYWQLMNQPADDVRLVVEDINRVLNRGLLDQVPTGPILPVTLTNFSAKVGLNNTVNLSWSTSTEVINKGFNIERQISNINSKFENIGFIPSKAVGGNSNIPLYYNFTDATTKNNTTNYYRLAQVDLDNKITYSGVKLVRIGSRLTGKMNIPILDMSGRMIQQHNNITDTNFQVNINNKKPHFLMKQIY